MHIKRVLAGWESFVGQSISFGIGSSPEAVGDTRLEFETAREDVKLVSYDFTEDRLVFKASVPAGLAGSIYEIGLYSHKIDNAGWQFGSRVISTFDSATEEWMVGGAPAAYTTTGSRTGIDSMRLEAAASGSQTGILDGIFLDLADGSVSDLMSFALNTEDANTSSISVRFKSDAANYFQFSLIPSGTGYQILTATKASATVTGTPRWAEISSIEVVLNATAGGTAAVSLDAIRIDSATPPGQRNVLVAREVLTVPYVKEEGKIQEIEFSLGVNI